MKAINTSALTFSKISANNALQSAINKRPAEIIGILSKSGLKGRGGAGFPTGVKWNLAAAAKDPQKVVVCNADEGEPGTFKDRIILNEYADLVFAGMTIGGYAIKAKKGIMYLRGEYSYLREQLEDTLARRRSSGLLGDQIRGLVKFPFDIEIRMGSGAYICGEETALIESLQGGRGEPRNRPPFPVDTGFFGHPTIVNNVETFAWVAAIMMRGADWFAEIGTDKSKGLKLFSVSGDVEYPGVYEFPLGITINELLFKVGGEGAKAVQVGGASGQCIPASQFERTIAFEDASTGGSIIVFGPGRDMLKVAHNFLEFFVEESCGQCTPCREGNVQLLRGCEKLLAGRCSMRELKELKDLGRTMQLASKCGLGQTAPNAFLSIIENFQEELLGRINGSVALRA